MTRQRSVFDIIEPVMIGFSFSHTAGAVRLATLARAMFGGQPRRAGRTRRVAREERHRPLSRATRLLGSRGG